MTTSVSGEMEGLSVVGQHMGAKRKCARQGPGEGIPSTSSLGFEQKDGSERDRKVDLRPLNPHLPSLTH